MKKTQKILIVDDDANICELVRLYLKKEGFETIICSNGEKALEEFAAEQPDLAILDIMMPKVDGMTVCREIRKTSNMPIIMLTAKGETFDKVLGLELGADDYMVKPFEGKELVARVKAQLRRYKRYNAAGGEKQEEILEHAGLIMNIKTHECLLNEKPLSLTPTEFSILEILCEKEGNVVSAEEMFHRIWGRLSEN